MMQRRTLLKLLALAPLMSAAKTTPKKKLVLVELLGGNDGINTLIPIRDPLYRKLRPNLAVDEKDALGVGEGQALHPSLEKLMTPFENGELAIVQGVGYAKPVRSHFRSADIWHTASASDELRNDGWLARVIPGGRGLLVDGDAGPLSGQFTALSADGDRPSRRTARAITNQALAHLDRVHEAVRKGHAEVAEALEDVPPGETFNAQCRVAARALEKIDVDVIKLTLKGFDTHAGQRDMHARLLRELGNGLSDLARRARALGIWNDTLIVTTSEFGRRAKENASGGTDHGTAAPMFVLGGRVRGGLTGRAPRLADLDDEGDLKFTTDFRALLAGVAVGAFGVKQEIAQREFGVAPLDLVRT